MALVYGAVYSGVPVYEMNCRQVAVMRRKSDSYLNATQILKVAGVDKGRRTKILEREVQTGEHEKVQGGYGKYQGTWIPYERGLDIARQYGVEELLRPILDYQPNGDEEMETPRKRRAPSRAKSHSQSGGDLLIDAHDYHQHQHQQQFASRKRHSISSVDSSSVAAAAAAAANAVMYDPSAFLTQQSQYAYSSQTSYGTNAAVTTDSNGIPRASLTNNERYRAILMSVFLNHENHRLPDLLTTPNPPEDLNVDMIIDDQGHTSLHWAAALSRQNVLQLLLNLGADPRFTNVNGESALVRTVLVTNSYDKDSFYDTLVMLHSSIDLVDKKGRSIIHHIALTAGVKGRAPASRYYLETLFEMMQKNNLNISSLVDLQDKNGDTALNIAARIGSKHLVELLLKFGADPELPNRAGLRPVDFCMDDPKLASLFMTPEQQANAESSFKQAGSSEFTGAIAGNLEAELAANKSQLQDALEQISAISKDLAAARRVISKLVVRNATMEQQNAQYRQQLGSEPAPPAVPVDEKIVQLEQQVAKYRALLVANEIPVDDLENTPTDLNEQSQDSVTESKVNQLLAQVLNVPADVATTLVDPLMTAINTDGNNVSSETLTSLMQTTQS